MDHDSSQHEVTPEEAVQADLHLHDCRPEGSDCESVEEINSATGINTPEAEAIHRSRRKYGRVRIENLPCNLGTVIDLSASGIRLISQKAALAKPGRMVTVELEGISRKLRLPARIIWVHKIGFRKRVVGLLFHDITDEQRSCIARICRAYAMRFGASA
ncbi:MAG TPA: PilZ domain-containing protein [Phycisphaeraceae bacterium]|nr:PilZ domain-containing protein [Phycisphaeraceae bacterium]